MTDNRTFTKDDGVPESTGLPDTLFGMPIVYNNNVPDGEIRMVLGDWDEWMQYRWRGPDGEWHTQWGSRGL